MTLGTLGLGAWGVRFVRTTSDLLVASRSVTAWWNAAAISGEYLSAASFLGIAGLEMKLGASALWQSLGFTAGYLALLLFVAAPLRRFGSYTIPDFAEARLRSPRIRLLAAAIVLADRRLLPAAAAQGSRAGAERGHRRALLGRRGARRRRSSPSTSRIGGMRGITYVQAFQFWIKVFAISVPACLLLHPLRRAARTRGPVRARVPERAADALIVSAARAPARRVPGGGLVHHRTAGVHGARGRASHAAGARRRPARPPARRARRRGDRAATRNEWSRPVGGTGESSPLLVYSLLIATFLGTMGLPHILVRFYTNPDGHAARRTTVRVLTLLGLFYVFPAVYGAMGRALTPRALHHRRRPTRSCSRCRSAAWPGTVGTVLGALTAAGAFAAFLSTSSGLLVSLAGTISHDIWPRLRREPASGVSIRRAALPRRGRLARWSCRRSMALLAQQIDISILVGWAFAIAASTFCPMFLLGIWWTRLSARGAAAGMLSRDAVMATAAIFVGLALGDESASVTGALLAQPAIVSVPVAFLVMIVVSLRDPRAGRLGGDAGAARARGARPAPGRGRTSMPPVAPSSVMIER